MDSAKPKQETPQSLSRRKARRKALELVFEYDQHPGISMEELLERTFNYEKWYQGTFPGESYACEDANSSEENSLEDNGEIVVSKIDQKNEAFIRTICTLVAQHKDLLDEILSQYPHEWRYDRIGNPEKAILRMALSELIFMDTPIKVAINEALDLTKLYGEKDSNRFINGILGAVVKNLPEIKARCGVEP